MELITEIGEIKIKLSLGESHKEPHLSTIDLTRAVEEFDIWLEIKGNNEVQQLKKLFQAQGLSATKFCWDNWSQYEISANDVIEMLNFFPKLEFLKLSSWQKEFTGIVKKVNLPSLKSLEISDCNNFIIDFVANTLPENSIEELTISGVSNIDSKLCNFINKQMSIKRLNIHADLNTVEPLTHLKLDYLRCILEHRHEELEHQREFLQTLIKSQVNLTSLDLFHEEDHSLSFVNDSTFADICTLSKLENLSLSIDSMTPDKIKIISNIKTLKKLTLKIFKNDTLDVLKEFSAINNLSIESLVLNLCYEVPTETYEAIGENYKNLKSLTIALGTRHRISFFARVFPNLESLNIKYGKVNDPVEFNQVYNHNDNIKSWKLKVLNFNLHGKHIMNTESFVKFLSFLPNLKKLKVDSKFQFSANFINQLAHNLNNIKTIRLLNFEIEDREIFNSEIVDALKLLRSKLDSVSLVLLNMQSRILKNDAGISDDFSYQPLIDALRDIYELRIISYANIRVCEKLAMSAGAHESWE